MKKSDDNVCQCGCIDTNTGEWKKGVVHKDGKMTFENPIPLWRRFLFGTKYPKMNVWSEPEFVSVCDATYTSTPLFGNAATQKYSAAVYRQKNIFNGDRKYFVRSHYSGDVLIDCSAYEKFGRLVIV